MDSVKRIADNRKARHDYYIEEELEAGIELFGTEVKSIRAGACNLRDAFCAVKDGELFAHNVHISPYEHGNIHNRDPLRPKRLLLHRREIEKLRRAAERDGFTLIPLNIYLKGARVKVTVALARGKKLYDKRESEKERETKRELDRAKRDKNR
ncbi:MAG: SsrA-binding protein SmpB [Oscillospiraceae bacterium]|jgi:SsrA-binding protein|nr:SsrA-binding protein SmpB [Oscillospiraceae bacterium]